MASQEIEKISSSLPIDEDLRLHEQGRLVQQISIIAIFIFILLAVLGLFGNGILSDRNLHSDGTTLRYERFGRHEAQSKLSFNLSKDDTVTQISLPAAYFGHFKIETIVPEPDSNVAADNYLTYTFNGTNTRNITFFLSPIKTGEVKAMIKCNQTNFQLSHFIYP